MKQLNLASILIIAQLINIDRDALSGDSALSMCVCGGVGRGAAGRRGHSPTSFSLRLRGSFLHPVSISYSRCHSVCHILVCHTETTVEWAAAIEQTSLSASIQLESVGHTLA